MYHKLRLPAYIIAFLSIFIAQTHLRGMDGAQVAVKPLLPEQDLRNLKLILPFSKKPIMVMPQFAYENCNQVTCHTWTGTQFDTYKKTVATFTKPQLEEAMNRAQEGALKAGIPFDRKKEFDKKAELYDWIHGLNLIEKEYLPKRGPITIPDIKRINKALTRLMVDNPGEFRQGPTLWMKYDISDEEWAFFTCVDPSSGTLKSDQKMLGFNEERNEVPVESVRTYLQACMLLANTNADMAKYKTLNLDTVQKWVEEQKGLVYSDGKAITQGCINIEAWMGKRAHVFPAAQDIPGLLQKVLDELPKLGHPIAQAAYLWYQIIKIHPWHEANKRTGKALAAWWLLQNGYLVPLITKEDESTL